MRRGAPAVLLLLVVVGCGIRDEPQVATVGSSSTVDSTPTDSAILYGTITAIEDSLRRFAGDPRTPRWLWEAGRLLDARLSNIEPEGPAGRYAREHPDDYWMDTPWAVYRYTQRHLRELTERFPDYDFADDAAYLLAKPFEGSECEGDFVCGLVVRKRVGALTDFIRRYPRSEYTPEAVRRANETFTSTLTYVEKGLSPGEHGKPEPLILDAVDSLLASYETATLGLLDTLRTVAQTGIAESRAILKRLPR